MFVSDEQQPYADQGVEVSDGRECSDGKQAISDCNDGVDGTAGANAGDQLGHEVRLHYLGIIYFSCSSSSNNNNNNNNNEMKMKRK